MDTTVEVKRLRIALQHAQKTIAILSGAIDPNDDDDLPPPASGSLIAPTGSTTADSPINPRVEHGACTPTGPNPEPCSEPTASTTPMPAPDPPVGPSSTDPADDIDVNPRTAMFTLASKPAQLPRTDPGPLFPAPEPKRNTKVGAQLRKRANIMYHENPENAIAEWDATKSVLAELTFISNPYLRRGREEMLEAHYYCLETYEPHLKEEEYFHTEVVMEFACMTLHFRIKNTRGRDGGPIRSRTAVSWLGYHVFNICAYTRDPTSKELSGLTLLRRGLLSRLENLVKWSVIEYDLVRHIGHQHVLDRPAIQLMIEHILTGSESSGRNVAFQTLVGLTFAMNGAFRSGTMQSNCIDYRKQKMVGHMKVHVRAPGRFAPEIDTLNWKGYSGVGGLRKTITFDPVTKSHNLIFEPGCYLALDLLARNLLDGINTIDELIAYDKALLPIKEDAKELPLFLKRTPRGSGVIEGVPCGPHKISQIFNHHAVAVGLPGGGVHAVRRGSARHYVSAMGQDKTLALLNHGDRTGVTLTNHYVPETHVPLVAIRMNELEGKLSPLEEAVMRNQNQGSVAIHTLARRLQSTDARGAEIMREGRCRITPQEEAQVQEDPIISKLLGECEAAWKLFTELFPNANEPFTRHFVSTIKRVRLTKTNASEALIQVRVDELERLGVKLRNARRQAFKRVRRSNHKALESTVISIEARNQAEKLLDEPSELIAEAKEQMKFVISDYLKARRGTTEQDDESGSDSEEECDTQMTEQPLTGRGLPPPATTISGDKPRISQLDVSLQSAPKVTIPELEDTGDSEEETFDDTAEEDVIDIPVDIMRAIYMRYIWKAHLAQKNPVEPNSKGELICAECPKFHSRKDKPKAFTFKTRSKFNRHMREQHDNYSNLELEMQTDSPDRFKCPGCDQADFTSIKSCYKHCREACIGKAEFMQMHQAHKAWRKTETNDDMARRDRDKVYELVGTEVECPEEYLNTIEELGADLENPGFLQDWANSDGVKMGEDVERGHDMDDLQKLARQSTEIVLEGTYCSGPDDRNPIGFANEPIPDALVASGPNVLTAIRDKAVEILETSNPENMSDYDTESNSDTD
ncbi:unnamed protein product [Rhizoctonia solani]|uniref:Uncharacterized protein n=1 Tax=Rhizoctonia solani TaxID=456999 RepID=A0A8H3E650_9AGAM|nr:unnamed protein product [Rhizoctonia solani]